LLKARRKKGKIGTGLFFLWVVTKKQSKKEKTKSSEPHSVPKTGGQIKRSKKGRGPSRGTPPDLEVGGGKNLGGKRGPFRKEWGKKERVVSSICYPKRGKGWNAKTALQIVPDHRGERTEVPSRIGGQERERGIEKEKFRLTA